MALAKKLARIRKYRFLYVHVVFCQPVGIDGWIIEGHLLNGKVVKLAAGTNLKKALKEAAIAADRFFDEYGNRRTPDITNPKKPKNAE